MFARRIALSLLASVLLLPVGGLRAAGTFRIGAILTLTGPAAAIGRAEHCALEIGVGQLNAAGGLVSHAVELVVRDDSGDAARAAMHARELAKTAAADILIGGSVTETSLAIADVAQRAGMVFLALGGSVAIAKPVRRWIYRVPPGEDAAVAGILDGLKSAGQTKIAALQQDSDFGRAAARELRVLADPRGLGAKRFGISLAGIVQFRVDGDGLAGAMKKLSALRDVQAVVVLGAGEGMAVATRWIRDEGIRVPVWHTHGSAVSEFTSQAASAVQGVHIVAPAMFAWRELPAGDPQRSLIEAFVADYRGKYEEEPSPFAGYARDALGLAAAAVRRAQFIDAASIQGALDATRGFAGVTGTFAYWPSDRRGVDDAALRVFVHQQGKWTIEAR